MKRIGIEKINIYGCSLCVDQKDLALGRDKDPEQVLKDYLIETRSLNPLWEDTVTMAANAAFPILTEQDKKDIGMLIVGTEGSVDFGKPMSSNLHGQLGLNANVRNYETKFACYSGVAALDAAVNWIASGLNKGKKALVIATDFSRMHLGKPHEFVLGGAAAAVLVSENPKILEYELEKKGSWTFDVYDTFRPTARHESGNNEVSLYSYMDALEGAYKHYCENAGEDVDFDSYFKYNIYHMPFPGMAFQAHRVLCNLSNPRKKSEIREDFNKRVMPSLFFAQRVGSTYGASNFIGLCGLLSSAEDVKAGDRIGFFSYGSGSIGEYYSGIICEGAVDAVKSLGITEMMDARKKIPFDQYEALEKERNAEIESRDFSPDLKALDSWYDEFYKGKNRLILKEISDYYRKYEWA